MRIGRNGSYARRSTRRVALKQRLLARLADAVRRHRQKGAERLDAREAHGLVAAVIAVGYRLLTAPFCMGFAGIEAFCAFLAVATHKLCQPRQESLFERNAAG